MTGRMDAISVGVDARSIFMPRPRGTGRNLLDAYEWIPRLRPDWQFTLYHQRDLAACHGCAAGDGRTTPAARVTSHSNVETRRIEMLGDRFDAWFQWRLPMTARSDRVNLLHLPANAAPAWCPVPYIVTVHDLIPLKVANEHSAAGRRKFRRGLLRAVRGAARIIAVSNATRDDLHDEFAVPLEKISVIGWAADSRMAAGAARSADDRSRNIRATQEKYGLRRPWLLGFSGASRRKNAFALIKAMAGLKDDDHGDVELVLVGCEPDDFRNRLDGFARRSGVAAKCRFLGFVPHEDIVGLLGGARGLVMPSLYEGFGLPILDAFALDVPVLTADTSSMPEVAADAAVYCNPHDTASITRSIVRLLNPRIAERLIRAGRRRGEQFNWQRTAEAICQTYERCLSESRRTGWKPMPQRRAPAPAEACVR